MKLYRDIQELKSYIKCTTKFCNVFLKAKYARIKLKKCENVFEGFLL